jgi:hypothetical protein
MEWNEWLNCGDKEWNSRDKFALALALAAGISEHEQ